MSDKQGCKTIYHRVKITVTRDPLTGHLNIEPDSPSITVTFEDSVITYEIVRAPKGVVFWSLDITPTDQRDFSPPVTSASGRMITIDNSPPHNNVGEFQVLLKLFDPDGGVVLCDPQIINKPA